MQEFQVYPSSRREEQMVSIDYRIDYRGESLSPIAICTTVG